MDVTVRYLLMLALISAVTAGCAGPQVTPPPGATVAVELLVPTAADAAPSASPTALNVPTVKYRIKPGETLAAIAARYGITVEELAVLNGISNPNLIQAGQEIRVPRQRVR